MINIVLHEPEIPFNTGAIGRTCVATDSRLHMIGPYGFVLNDKYLKRAGMDYWEKLKLSEYIDYEDFLSANKNLRFAGEEHEDREASSGSTDVSFGPDDFIMFGKESAGIPEEILVEHPGACVRIPMWGEIRSLNLSNSVAIILYEALRQNHFEELTREGELHRLHW